MISWEEGGRFPFSWIRLPDHYALREYGFTGYGYRINVNSSVTNREWTVSKPYLRTWSNLGSLLTRHDVSGLKPSPILNTSPELDANCMTNFSRQLESLYGVPVLRTPWLFSEQNRYSLPSQVLPTPDCNILLFSQLIRPHSPACLRGLVGSSRQQELSLTPHSTRKREAVEWSGKFA